MAYPLKHNWPELHKEFQAFDGTLKLFCEAKQLSYTRTSRVFADFDRESEAEAKRKAVAKLSKNAPIAADTIIQLSQDKDPNIRLKASTISLGMIGISPQASLQAAQVNVQVNVPALFANADNQDELRQLLQGGKVIEPADEA